MPWWPAQQPQLQVALAGIWNVVGLEIRGKNFSSAVNLKSKVMFSLTWLCFCVNKAAMSLHSQHRRVELVPHISFVLPRDPRARLKCSQIQPTAMLKVHTHWLSMEGEWHLY